MRVACCSVALPWCNTEPNQTKPKSEREIGRDRDRGRVREREREKKEKERGRRIWNQGE